jgi:ABC-type sugar transport system permease subunit
MITVGAVRMSTPIYLLTQGGPNGATTNIAYYAYVQNFQFSSPGHASASVIIMLLVLAAIGCLQLVLLRNKRRLAS